MPSNHDAMCFADTKSFFGRTVIIAYDTGSVVRDGRRYWARRGVVDDLFGRFS